MKAAHRTPAGRKHLPSQLKGLFLPGRGEPGRRFSLLWWGDPPGLPCKRLWISIPHPAGFRGKRVFNLELNWTTRFHYAINSMGANRSGPSKPGRRDSCSLVPQNLLPPALLSRELHHHDKVSMAQCAQEPNGWKQQPFSARAAERSSLSWVSDGQWGARVK